MAEGNKHSKVVPSLTRVAVQHPKFTQWSVLSRYFDTKDGFMAFPCQGPLDTILVECERTAPCVLLLDEDCMKPTQSGASTERVSFGPSIQVLVLGERHRPDVASLISAGCSGFLPDDASPDQLRAAVRAVAHGEIWAPRKTLSHLLQTFLAQVGPRALTRREIEVLRLITEGLKNRKIAERLCISHETVRWHIRSLYAKIGVHDRLGAVIYGRRLLETGSEGPSLLGVARATTASGPETRAEGA